MWRNNALSTFLGIITFMFVIPIAFVKNIFIICFELIFLLLLFKRIITNNINMNVNLDIIGGENEIAVFGEVSNITVPVNTNEFRIEDFSIYIV